MEYTTTVKFDPTDRRTLQQAYRNAGAVFPEGSLELTLLAPLDRAGNPLPKQRVFDMHWALRSLQAGLQEQSQASYWRRVEVKGVSQQALIEAGQVALIDREKFPETMAGIRQVQAREVERAVTIVSAALDGFPRDSDGQA